MQSINEGTLTPMHYHCTPFPTPVTYNASADSNPENLHPNEATNPSPILGICIHDLLSSIAPKKTPVTSRMPTPSSHTTFKPLYILRIDAISVASAAIPNGPSAQGVDCEIAVNFVDTVWTTVLVGLASVAVVEAEG